MSKKQLGEFINLTFIVISVGLIVVAAGVYFEINSLTSSGVTMGSRGGSYGTGTLNGKGMIFCGIVIAAFGMIFRDSRSTNKNDNEQQM